MGTADGQQWVQLVAQAAEAVVWLLLTVWSLERMRAHLWARLSAFGAVLLLIPASTLAAGRAQLMFGDTAMILTNFVAGPLPTVYAVMRVLAAVLLLAAVVVGRGAGRPAPDALAV